MTSEVVSSVSAEEEPTVSLTVTETTVIEQPQEVVNTITYAVPENQNGFKSWMPYTALSKNTINYKMLTEQGYVDDNGLWRIGEYYCVALGSYYSTQLGEIFELELSSGNIITVITIDHKADIHTDSNNQVTVANGCITEFIVDKQKLNNKIRIMGSVSVLPELEGTVVKITKILN